MDVKVGLNVYGRPWLIEPQAGLRLLDFFESLRHTEASWNYRRASRDEDEEDRESDYSIHKKLFAKSGVVFAPTDTYDLRYEFAGFDGAAVAVIPVQGPLMKSDFCGDLGTDTLAKLTRLAEQTKSVQTVVFAVDSPGGTVDGTEAFASVIKACSKPTIAVLEDIGCSAGYWIGSACSEIYAANRTTTVGCIGTMMRMVDTSKEREARGIVHREYRATESKDKNTAYSEALAGNGKRLIEEELDPLNSVFLEDVRASRGDKLSTKENVLTGKVYHGATAVEHGLVDGIRTLEQVVSTSLSGASSSKTSRKGPAATAATQTPLPMNVFQKALAAANAESFPVADGGFLLTEAQLTGIEASLATGQEVAEGVTKALASATANTLANADAAAKLATATARISELETSVAAKDDEIKALGSKPGGSFVAPKAEGETKPVADGEEDFLATASHYASLRD